MANPRATSTIQSRKVGSLKRSFKWDDGKASSGSVKLRDMLIEDLRECKLYDLLSDILDAPYHGLAAIEIHWHYDQRGLRVKKLQGKDKKRLKRSLQASLQLYKCRNIHMVLMGQTLTMKTPAMGHM